MSLKVTIITATYNSEKHLEQTIQSVVNQTYPHVEYIIVDGASTDRTLEIVNRYRDRISKVISEPDDGIYDAFNKGLSQATGDIIYFLNSDDYLHDRDVIEKVVRVFEEAGPEVMVVYGDILKIDEQTGYIHRFSRQADMELFRQGKMPPHPGMFIRQVLFERYRGFNTEYLIASDFDLVLKAFKEYGHRFVKLDEIIAVFRIGGASTQLLNKKKLRQEMIEILNNHFGQSQLKPYTTEELNTLFYREWLKQIQVLDRPASKTLLKRGIRNVAVFGSLDTAVHVYYDLKKSGVLVHVFLDNNSARYQYQIAGIPITNPNWLAEHHDTIDAVLLAFSGEYDKEVRDQIFRLTSREDLPCISWRMMITWNGAEA